jgi:hypothetical protein
MESGAGVKPEFQLEVDNIRQGGVGNVTTNNTQWTPEGRERGY